MSLWSRISNVFRRDALHADIDEELRSHLEEAIEAGRDPAEARRAFGSALLRREESRDARLATWLDALRADLVFGWRLLKKNRTASAAAILSLALTIGACTAAFRLVDAILLRPMPVAAPDRLYFLTYEFTDQNGKKDYGDSFEYPLFRELRRAAAGHAELMAISYSGRNALTYGGDDAMEKVYRQYVSGWTFPAFGLKPAAGRLFTAADDQKPGAHPYAVISYDYWTRRFGRDPKVLGRTYRMGNDRIEIVGVAPEGFTGTETGTLTDIFTPTMMNARAINNANWGWFRIWVQVKSGVDPERVRSKVAAAFTNFRREKSKEWKGVAATRVTEYVNAPLLIEPASAGVSGMQKTYRRSLTILGGLVLLLLLIACANVANLMMAQAAARAREMALRISIGAGRWRLVQLVLAESALIAVLATTLGGLFAWWSAPFVVSMINPPDNPAQLVLPADWRVLGFAAALTASVIFLFGLAPALRASAVKPMVAIRGGDNPHSRRRLMNSLVAAQVAFCFLVHFVAGLFVATFERISTQPTGFASQQRLAVETVSKTERPYEEWSQLADQLRTLPGVRSLALCTWPLMSGNGWSGGVRVPGQTEWDASPPYFLGVSPGWLQTMEIPLKSGRDFRADDAFPRVAIVNEAFARRYFDGQNPVGRVFEQGRQNKKVSDSADNVEIVGLVADARYRNMREPIRPTAYVPLRSLDEKGVPKKLDWASIIVHTASADPTSIGPAVRQRVSGGSFRVANMLTQQEMVDSHTVRERLLAMLSLFFAVVALVLAGIGLYGVLNYSVLQRRREISIRIALGARAADVARRVTAEVFGMLVLGSAVGLTAGLASESYVESLLYQVKTTDWAMVAIPAVMIVAAGLLAALPPVIAAVRIDPANVLRAE